MRINRLYIKAFRNLKNFSIDFTPEGKDADGQIKKFNSHAIIGQNGSGKSNFLEAVIIIFRDLDLKNKPEFAYKLDYEIRGHRVEIHAESVVDLPWVTINKKKRSATYLSDHAAEYLPSNVFVYYSGKNQRIEALFQAHQNRFNKTLREDGDALIRRLFYCRSGHSQLVLLACLLSKDPVFKKILENLNIKKLESALFVIKQPNRLKKNLTQKDILNGDQRFWFAQGTVVSEFLDKLWDLSVAPIDETSSKQVDFRGRTENQEQIYLYLPDQDALEELGKLVGPAEVFFRYAEGAYIGDLIDEVRITVERENHDGTIGFENLSEGEMQLLTVLGLMRFTNQDHCLFLLDEPDTHLNPIWKLRYFDEIEKIIQPGENQTICGKSQILITTHDPIMIGSLRKEQVRILCREDDKCMVMEPDVHPQGMGISGLLKSELFGLRSTVDTETLRRLDKRNYLFALGRARTKLEDAELTRLSEELSDLGFASDFKDPYFAMFVQKMALHKKFHKQQLTPNEQKEQDAIADEIIDEILRESGK